MSKQKANIDVIEPSKSLIDLSNSHDDSLDSTLQGYAVDALEDDIVLVEFVDRFETGEEIIRNGIVIPANANPKAWRVGRVVLQGDKATSTSVGDFVTFPNNMGVPVGNVIVKYGKEFITVKKGQFINAQRIFGKLYKLKPTDPV
jgi:co-chaperonin GroES (HSP10)